MPRFRSIAALLVVWATIWPSSASAETDLLTLVHGKATVESTGEPVGWANIVAVRAADDSTFGAMTDDEGVFSMEVLPGTYRILALKFGLKVRRMEGVQILAGEIRQIDFELSRFTPNASPGLAVGSDVRIEPHEIELRMRAGQGRHRVGEQLALAASIHNLSRVPIVVPRPMDGSLGLGRSPEVWLEVEGPEGGVELHDRVDFCGNRSSLRPEDLVVVEPGNSTNPFESRGGDVPTRYFFGPFQKPGRYVVRLWYDMNEPSLKNWLGFPSMEVLSEEDERRLRNIPRSSLMAEIELVVDP